ncbi:MAG: hypothetical protein HYS25_16700 [Ignavibacteriales bacterium]|nr:hypothetical protein [Ignavibacteriales bacterium]
MNEEIPKASQPKLKRSLFRKIINLFIGIFLGIVLLLVLFIGFSQTKTFRDFLRDKIISQVNSSINGKLSIGKIEGTLLTSVFLRSIILTTQGDTLLNAKNVVVKVNVLQLLLKKIYVRNILLEDVKVKLLQNEKGEWNFEKLAKPTEEDTTKSGFTFLIEVNDLQLRNIDLVKQTFENVNSQKKYQTANFGDLRIDNIYLTARAFIDIQNSDYLLQLKELSFKPNLNRFTLRNISGEFAVTKNFAGVKNFALITDSSDLRLNARIDSLNLFGNVALEDFKNYPISIDLDAASINFDDLSSFIGSTEILKGNPSAELKASGKFGGFKIEKLIVDYRTTHFELSGEVLKLNTPENLYIKAKITDTDINYKDVNALLPSLELPEFAKLSVSGVNVEYEGEPVNFKTKFSGNIEDGFLQFDCKMNLAAEPMRYDINFETGDLDLSPVIGLTTLLNSKGSLTGKGVSPADLKSEFQLTVENSMFDQVPVDNFKITSKAADKIIELEAEGFSKDSEALILGSMEFDKDTIPTYSLVGSLKHLDLSSYLKDDEYKSDLNFYFSAEGKHIDIDEITGTFSFGVDSSQFKNTKINYSHIDVDFKKDSTYREINLKSDFVDFNINGKFSLKDALDLSTYEGKTISKIIADKLEELNPLAVMNESRKEKVESEPAPDIINKEILFNYDFTFKDFSLFAELFGFEKLDIIGSGSGTIQNKVPNFSVNSEIDLDYFIMTDNDSTIYLSSVEADINFTRDNRFTSFDNLFGTASLNGKRFYSQASIKNIAADVVFNQSKLFFSASADYEDFFKAEAEGVVLMTPNEQQIIIDKVDASYEGLSWTNKTPIKVLFNPQRFSIADCKVYNDTSFISINGIIESSGKQDINVSASKISGYVLGKLFAGTENHELTSNGEFNGKITGYFKNPIIRSTLKIDKLSYNNYRLGMLTGTIDYADKQVITGINFLDSTYNANKPLLTFSGTIPVDLSFGFVKDRMIKDQQMDLKLVSIDFNLRSLGNTLPGIKDQSGNLVSDISIKGTISNPQFSGYLTLSNGYFLSTYSNLPYSTEFKMKLEEQGIIVDNFTLANAGGTKYPGTIKGYGTIMFDGFSIKDLLIRFNGDIALLSNQSRTNSPLFYGDLKIGTGSDWLLTLQNERLFFKGDILLKETNLTITTTEQAAQSNNNFNIIYVIDSTKIDREQIKFQEILSGGKNGQAGTSSTEKKINIDYDIGVKVENTARITFILSQAVNQRLLVEMRGDLQYVNIGGATRAQGAFTLMPGSKLEFFKNFDAEGFLRFESDVTNPYLDVVATYTSDYINPRDADATPQDVAVKIKIKGPLNDLGKNLTNNPESMGIYVGSRNIQNNVRESRYDYADAFSFILIGKFKDDLTAQDKTQVAGLTNDLGNTATSFLGPILTSFVNSAVGDLINNIQISQSGEYTKFNLSGRIQNLRYSFGGTTELFQNLNKANIKIEYLFDPKFLIRLERKDPVAQTFGLDEKINEIALKYRFEF